jgi:hypothetical protein
LEGPHVIAAVVTVVGGARAGAVVAGAEERAACAQTQRDNERAQRGERLDGSDSHAKLLCCVARSGGDEHESLRRDLKRPLDAAGHA